MTDVETYEDDLLILLFLKLYVNGIVAEDHILSFSRTVDSPS